MALSNAAHETLTVRDQWQSRAHLEALRIGAFVDASAVVVRQTQGRGPGAASDCVLEQQKA